MAALYKRGPVYWVKYYLPGKPKPIRVSLKTTKESVAKKKLRILEGQLAAGEFVDMRARNLRVDALLDAVVTDYSNNGRKTLSDLETRIDNHLSPFFGTRPAVSVTSADIADYIASRRRGGAANATINRELAVLKRAYTLAWKAYRLPGPAIEKLAEHNVRAGFFDRSQLDALCRKLPDFLIPVAQFAYLTGWRLGEIQQLEWRHVDFERGEIRLDPGTTKNEDGRVFKMTAELREILEPLKPADSLRPWVFAYTTGGKDPKRKTAVKVHRLGEHRKVWKAACTAAGLPGRIFHDLRRSAVRQFIRDGIHERVAMQLSGHRTREIFDRYHIVSDSDLDRARELTEAGTKPGTTDTGSADKGLKR